MSIYNYLRNSSKSENGKENVPQNVPVTPERYSNPHLLTNVKSQDEDDDSSTEAVGR